ncbi:SgcJ/EcaC family oxidoreductase [Chitinophaga sp. G-6-1-13]|uniref:SgcJ/EcaC family oxidoreductase n=1 Tax=Chitinophaga fulva TaxID=2728842 RepID=A0A848GKF9_9BACT|nr:SgcJ/EcaC family oxidoreductase [Chitinophaga fulva]NML37889.1 SgcJ/EcaC family oxidoreductase [Chitinophaga fulva]
MNKVTEMKAIRQVNEEIYRSFETLDFKGAAVHLTEDCDYITFNGMHLKGRQEYITSHEQLMNNFMFRGAKLEGEIDQMRFLNDRTAVVIARGAIRFRWQKKAPQSRHSINTTLWIKNNEDQWQMAAFHNCRIKKPGWLMKTVMAMITTDSPDVRKRN